METETKPQDTLAEETPNTPVSAKSKGHKQNGEAEHPLHNGDSVKNGVEEQRVPELRRSTRSTPSKKKEEQPVQEEVKEKTEEQPVQEEVKEKTEEDEESPELEKGKSPETPEDFKIYKKSFSRNESRRDQETMTPSTSSDITLSGKVSGRRSLRQQFNRKRKADDIDVETDTTPTKKATLNESWIKSPGWRYLATPFSKFFSSTPRPGPESDSMIVQYDEKTINCREDVSMADMEGGEKPTSKWGCSLM